MNTIQTKARKHWLALGKLSGMAVALVFSVLQSFAQPSASQPVKNVVLVHGAFSDGSSWAKVIPLLEAKGLHVTAVQNPLSSLADDVEATRRAIAKQDGPVILVGHSWAGMVISEVGNDPKVAGLVYVAAIVPDEGQSASDVLKPYPAGPGLAEAKPDASGYLLLTRKGIDEDFVPDLPPAERANIFAIQGAWNSACLSDKVSVPAWKGRKSWFIAAAADRMLLPEYQKAIAEHIHANTTTLAAGHVPMLSKPKQVAAVIIEAANKPFTAPDAAHANSKFVFPANFKTQKIQTDGATIHVRVGGQGPVVVLIHGFGFTGDMWAPMAAELARDHRVVVPDLRGIGLSSHPADGYDKKTQAADVRSVLTQLDIDHAAIVGHDIGATVAYAYAARYPDKTDRLVMMDAPVPGIPPWDDIVRMPALWHFSFGGPNAERLVAGRERVYLDRFWNEFAADPSKIDEATREHYTEFYARPGAMRSAFAQFLSIPKDVEDNKVSVMTKLTMPVLALGAEKAFGKNVGIIMRNAADNVTEVLIENSGHWLMDEKPAETIAAVRDFLDRKTADTKSLTGKQTAAASPAPTKQFLVRRISPAYWRVTFNHPPLNIFGPDSIPQLNEIITALETNEDVKVVVFDSAVLGIFMTHYDFLAKPEDTTSLPPGPNGLGPFNDMLVRLSRAPVVSIASIRGRATGNGSELALACDMRFASREKAILSHFEVGAGVVPGGGPMARLPRLMGRGRALEVLLGANDIPGGVAELYGYVNRSLPDSDLDGFVENLATRIASFDKRALSETKSFVNVASLPPDSEIAPEWDVCIASIMRPAAQTRIKKLMERGFHKPGDVENRLGYHVGQLGD